jgi:hypothetical protein
MRARLSAGRGFPMNAARRHRRTGVDYVCWSSSGFQANSWTPSGRYSGDLSFCASRLCYLGESLCWTNGWRTVL